LTHPLKIAVAGLGTVGAGALKILHDQSDLLARRCGRRLEVTAVSARNRKKDRGVQTERFTWFDDPLEMAREADADVVLEMIGGADGTALALCETAIASGRHVVTANKALLAHHGTDLARKAEASDLVLAYEAAVAGGIPIVKAMREGLAANRLSRVYGILNGTSNFILTQMRASGRSFDEVLVEAQELGYAESDPGFDIDGVDAGHKLAILTSLAFGCEIDFGAVHIEGIRRITSLDIEYADELGYRIKLLATARRTENGIEQRVHPSMVRATAPIAYVEGVTNAVVADGDFIGSTIYEGPGAGAGPTASAVVADIVDIACDRKSPTFAIPAKSLEKLKPAPMDRHTGSYYIRLMVFDEPGVVAEVAAALRDEKVSLEALLQKARAPQEAVPVVLTTHNSNEAAVVRALDRIAKIAAVREPPCMIRIEDL
jgi:homoserine dehydrogenase